jgi:asparagine synthase (glutamine-hydrolysing)
MRKYTNANIKTFSVGFENQPEYNELKYAEKIAKQFKTEHIVKIVSASDIKEKLPLLLDAFDDPISDVTSIPIYFISELAYQNNIKVVLTGDGADEIFAGYNNYLNYYDKYKYYQLFLKCPFFLRNSVGNILGSVRPNSNLSEMLNRAIDKQEMFWGSAGGFKEKTKRTFLSDTYQSKVNGFHSHNIIQKYRRRFDELNSNRKHTYLDWMCFLGYQFVDPNRYLVRMDRLGMLNSVEIRSPFLNNNFASFALSVPTKHKIFNKQPKYILKKALEPYLTKEILYRKKMGFVVPIREWAASLLTEDIKLNLEKVNRDFDFFNKEAVFHALDKINNGDKTYTNKIWMVYFLSNWLKRWFL